MGQRVYWNEEVTSWTELPVSNDSGPINCCTYSIYRYWSDTYIYHFKYLSDTLKITTKKTAQCTRLHKNEIVSGRFWSLELTWRDHREKISLRSVSGTTITLHLLVVTQLYSYVTNDLWQVHILAYRELTNQTNTFWYINS